MSKKFPMQPLVFDAHKVVRFKGNAIIEHLFTSGALDLNKIAGMKFSAEDRQQLAQLLGYSVDGYCTFSYVDDKAWKRVHKAKAKFMKKEQEKNVQS